LRLTPRGREIGLVDDVRWDRFEARKRRFERNLAVLDATSLRSASGERMPASQLLRQPEVRLADVVATGQLPQFDLDGADASIDLASAETTVKYAGYLRRQESEIARSRKDELRRIPADFPFDRVPGLSREVVQRLFQIRPDTLGQALRIPGVTPAAVAVLGAFVGRLSAPTP
jgi:tRNA uridine 5-carboxymethylaminomethyl modification enzyme